MNEPRHTKGDLQQMQSLPLERKIEMTKRRIREWYESWHRLEIINLDTGKRRFETVNTDGSYYDLQRHIAENEFIESDYPGAVYVSFSGGKDSTVLKHIVDSMYSDVPAVFVNTGLEYPEIQRFVRDIKSGKYDCFNSDVTILRPEMRFDEVIKKFGYPIGSKRIALNIEYGRKAKDRGDTRKYEEYIHGLRYGKKDGKEYRFMPVPDVLMPLVDSNFKISNKCCNIMKKYPLHSYQNQTGRKTIMATMACESKQRESGWFQTGCNAFDSKEPKSKPMSFWTEQDVLHYIKKFNVPYCHVYGDIVVKPTSEIPEQMNVIDFLGCYEPEDILTTTGCDRTGCMFCMFGCHLEKEPNRFQRMKETHPNQYKYCMKPVSEGGLGLAEVLDYIGVKYE